jgi:hypothetical protein
MPSPEGPIGPIQPRPALRGLWKSMDDIPGVETPGCSNPAPSERITQRGVDASRQTARMVLYLSGLPINAEAQECAADGVSH